MFAVIIKLNSCLLDLYLTQQQVYQVGFLLVVCTGDQMTFSGLFNLSNVIGSIIQDESVFTLLIATYDMPGVFSFLPMSIHAFVRVNPWLFVYCHCPGKF